MTAGVVMYQKVYLESDGHPVYKWLFQLDDEPNLYMETGSFPISIRFFNGWK